MHCGLSNAVHDTILIVPMRRLQVLDIEETIWSPKYGLKGMLDASVRVSGGGSGGLYPGIMPFELKTGRGTTGMVQGCILSMLTSKPNRFLE